MEGQGESRVRTFKVRAPEREGDFSGSVESGIIYNARQIDKSPNRLFEFQNKFGEWIPSTFKHSNHIGYKDWTVILQADVEKVES